LTERNPQKIGASEETVNILRNKDGHNKPETVVFDVKVNKLIAIKPGFILSKSELNTVVNCSPSLFHRNVNSSRNLQFEAKHSVKP